MKKILFAVLASTFATALMGADLVYDYKASIKRIDPSYKLRTVNKYKTVTETYSVASDTISGYVVIPACKACDTEGTESSLENTGYAYLVRKGDKYAKKNGLPFILKTTVTVDAAFFGAYVTGHPEFIYKLTNDTVKDAKKAWMSLSYSTGAYADKPISTKAVLPSVGSDQDEPLPYGFFGLDNIGGTKVEARGFGTAKIMTWKEAGDLGFCEGSEDAEGSCSYITAISGTLVGDPAYQGLCGATPMWDICSWNTVKDAVISGTWTLKYNKTLTKVADDEKEDAILTKLGYKQSDDMIEQ